MAIGLDVGGTKIAGGVLAADGTVLEQVTPVASPATDQNATVRALIRIVAELRNRHPSVQAVGVGAAGLVEWPDGHIRWAPNNAYCALPLRHILQAECGLASVVDNDANTAAWAEARIGRRATNMAFLTVGTGLGGGLVINGQLYRGKTGIGAEVGHITVDADGGQQCGCGNLGCLEAVASGTALERWAAAAAVADPTGSLAKLAGGASRVTGEIVLAAARAGDTTACALFERLGYWLGVGIASLVALFDFDLIVVGGGVVAAGSLIIEPARASLERFLFARAHRPLPEIVEASLGAEAGWIGAALLAIDLPTSATVRHLRPALCDDMEATTPGIHVE
jgi:glucokinase